MVAEEGEGAAVAEGLRQRKILLRRELEGVVAAVAVAAAVGEEAEAEEALLPRCLLLHWVARSTSGWLLLLLGVLLQMHQAGVIWEEKNRGTLTGQAFPYWQDDWRAVLTTIQAHERS